MSAQRPLPFSGQSMANGSTSRGSPNGTMAWAKRAVTWRTALISPCGEKNSTPCAEAVAHQGATKANSKLAMREGNRRQGGMRVLEALSEGGSVNRRMAAVEPI